MPPWHAWAWNVSQLMGFVSWRCWVVLVGLFWMAYEITHLQMKRRVKTQNAWNPTKSLCKKSTSSNKNSTNLGTPLEFQQATLWNPGIDLYYIHRRPDSCGVWSCLIGVMVWVSLRIRDLWHFAKIQVTRIGIFLSFFYNGYISPYYWVDDNPLLYGNNGSLDPSTFICKSGDHSKVVVPC